MITVINKSYDVDVYDIDLFDSNKSIIQELHNDGKKVICYFSGGSYENWRDDEKQFKVEVLGNDLDEWPGEKWLDIRSDTLHSIMESRFNLAKEKACDGVEVDNLDAYVNNSGFNLTADDQITYNKYIAVEAHKRGLSIGLKNDLDQIVELEPFYDFAVNEQCHEYNECDMLKPFTSNNKAVFNAEYNSRYLDDSNMTTLCDNSNNINFSTLILPLELDDTFRYDCKKSK